MGLSASGLCVPFFENIIATVHDGDESDKDCGGSYCPPCALAGKCGGDSDCFACRSISPAGGKEERARAAEGRAAATTTRASNPNHGLHTRPVRGFWLEQRWEQANVASTKTKWHAH